MNKVVICCAVLVFVAATNSCWAYNFDDAEFNEILAEDLKEMYNPDTWMHPRNRRDEEAATMMDKCRGRKKKLCCGETVFDKRFEDDKELKRACFKEVTGKGERSEREHGDREDRGEFDPFRCDKVEKHRKEMTCVMQCVGQKKNVIDQSGNIDEEKFSSFVKESLAKESWLASLQDNVISTCIAEAKNATASHDSTDSESCNPAGVKVAHCMFREIQLNCPADQIKDQKSCSRLQERLKKHNDFYHHHPPPPHDE